MSKMIAVVPVSQLEDRAAWWIRTCKAHLQPRQFARIRLEATIVDGELQDLNWEDAGSAARERERSY
jgi:hypothetical protein